MTERKSSDNRSSSLGISHDGASLEQPARRDFLYVATGSFLALGGGLAAYPFIDQMNPDSSVLAASTTEVDLSPIAVGQSITVLWRSKPVFIRHRTAKEIKEAEQTPLADLIDPATDATRVQRAPWLVVIGICTHLGCVPIGQKAPKDGWWLCPCHGSHYDTSGRVRRGPAPSNLEIPPYSFLSDNRLKIG